MARIPPVMQPDMMAFKESSFCRYDISMHSQLENIPPHRPKLPPRKGARFRTWQSPLNIRCPLGAFIKPKSVTDNLCEHSTVRFQIKFKKSLAKRLQKLTFDEVEESTAGATNCKPVAKIFEDAARAWCPIVLYF